ncbi:peptidoglycan-binding protein [Leptolyngbya sp. FACHB-261]|uniref:peptidoglycan-binding domain-containing protein n=1 Tax=Leptolyngbya sp. FACHB-261 TaxID=2692806 RepID=UPI0018EF874F|nr:peptidoglycan-binding domain-containing protein [Leptolyngbya sp. FACHB-261]
MDKVFRAILRTKRLLISEGYGPNLPVTGYFGDETAAAVENFQQAAGLAQDGVVGPDTWQALIVPTVAN